MIRSLATDTRRVAFKDAVSHAGRGLMNLQCIKSREGTFHRDDAAAIGDQGVVQTHRRRGAGEDAAPVTGTRRVHRAIVARVKRAAGTKLVVQFRGENHALPVTAFRQQLSPYANLDPRAFQLHNRIGFDHQAGVQARADQIGRRGALIQQRCRRITQVGVGR